MALKLVNPTTGKAILTEHDDGKIDFHDQDFKEQWEAQQRIEESVAEQDKSNATTNSNNPHINIDSKKQAHYGHGLLHSYIKKPPDGWTKESIEKEHTRVVSSILSKGWKHTLKDDLDKTLSNDLQKRSQEYDKDSEEKLLATHNKLHKVYQANQDTRFTDLHDNLVLTMLESGIEHQVTDNLDKSLSPELRELV